MDKWLNHPTALKIMALGIGILMWAVVHWDSNGSNGQVASLIETKKITAIVQPVGLDDGNYILHSLEPKTVTLTVGGTRNDLNRAKSEDFTVEVDLRGVGAGEHMLALTAPDLPRGIDLTSIAPSQAKVVIEALATKEFEVEIETQGNPAQGYKAGTPIVKPSNRAHVTLPENTLAKVAKVAGVISVEGKSATIPSQSVKLSRRAVSVGCGACVAVPAAARWRSCRYKK